MAVEMAIWRMTGDKAAPLESSPLDRESDLEDMVEDDPAAMIGTDLLIIGRQVPTPYRGRIDLLGLDDEGRVHVLELKRDKTPRDVVAQTLDYGSWVKDLDLEDLTQIYAGYRGDLALGEESDQGDETGLVDLEAAFVERFGHQLPDMVDSKQRFTIIASELDPASGRIVEFLAESYGVPINAVFFRHYRDDGRDYLARTWLLDPQQVEADSRRASRTKRRPWNGRDFYVVLGRGADTYRWELASKYGLLSAGGGKRYWKPLRNLEPGRRVFAYVGGGAGYVGIGLVTGQMEPARKVQVEIDGRLQPLLDQPCPGGRTWKDAASEDLDVTEMVVPVQWLAPIRTPDQAFREPGLFSSPTTVCKLRDAHTIRAVETEFGLAPRDS